MIAEAPASGMIGRVVGVGLYSLGATFWTGSWGVDWLDWLSFWGALVAFATAAYVAGILVARWAVLWLAVVPLPLSFIAGDDAPAGALFLGVPLAALALGAGVATARWRRPLSPS